MAHRFFSLDPIAADQVNLVDEQAHHLLHVMRFKVGQQVTVFDGSGCEAVAEITQMNKRQVTLSILERQEIDRELSIDLVVAVSIPKGDRQKFLVEKLVEVGVKTMILLKTERSVAQPSTKVLERLRKSVIEASKQCERNRLMEIIGETKFSELCEASRFADHQRLIATTHGASQPLGRVAPNQKCLLLVGPEGGFSTSENEQANQNGFTAIRLGASILRTETAAITAAAILGFGSRHV